MTADKSDVARRICADIKHVCKTFGNRNSGSEGEKKTAEYFSEMLSSCADDVKTETFKVNPNAFAGWITTSVTCAFLGLTAYFFSTLVATLLFIVALIPLTVQYLLYKRTLDPLYKEAVSQNVTAVKKCRGDVKRRIYFTANMDASFENCVKHRFGGITMIAVIVFDFIGFGYFIALSVARWIFVGGLGAGIANGVMLYAGLAGLVFAFPLFLSYFMVSRKTVVDGANTNLSGCFVAVNVLQALKEVEFENTEVGVILTGSGAVGLRGAKAWCDLHKDEIDKENTCFIALSTLREVKCINVNKHEMNGIVKCDKEVIKLVLDSAKKVDVKCSNHKIPFEATDSSAFTQAGFKSTGIVAINSKLPDYYYTRYDSYDNLSEECIAECCNLTLEIVNEYSGEDVLSAMNTDEAVDTEGVDSVTQTDLADAVSEQIETSQILEE